MSYAPIPGFEPEQPVEHTDTMAHLKAELGWPEVRVGLGRILLGYLVIIAGNLLGLFLVVFAVWQGQFLKGDPFKAFKKASGWHVLSLLVGMLLLGLVTLISYLFLILPGHWRCLLNSPERKGARWLIFATLLCIVMGPALNIACGWLMGGNNYERIERDLQRGQGIGHVELDPSFVAFQVGCIVIEVIGVLVFLFYLRAVALCFDDGIRARIVEIYIGFVVLLFGGGAYLAYSQPKVLANPVVALGFLGALAFAFLWYLALFPILRSGITQGLSQIRSPLEEDPVAYRPVLTPGNML